MYNRFFCTKLLQVSKIYLLPNMKGKKQSPSSQQNQQTFLRMLTLYKRKCELFGVIPNLTIKQILDKSVQTLKLDNIKFSQTVGPIQMRALMQTLTDTKFIKIKVIQIWKSKIGDEGVRNICKYLEQREGNVVEILDVLDNQITSLGCQFLGKAFHCSFTRIKYLKLDDNIIGNSGIENLAFGLRTNPHLTKLSLKYCGITEKGVKFVQEILANISSKIRSIKLQGNPIGNEGVYQFLRAKINIADTGLNLLDFQAKNLYVIDENYVQQLEQQQADDQNPEKRQGTPASNIQNVKQVIVPQKANKQQQPTQKVAVLKQLKNPQKKQHYKITKSINQLDKSLPANILRLLTQIMRQNMLIRKYDLRFNPISDDAAIILFQIIEQNSQIKDVEINNNVDNALRENLDTLMRKRTGRLPKGRRGGKGGKKKKK